MKINDTHRKAIRLLVEGYTPDEVGKEIGRKLSTVVLWMLEGPFLREWRKRRVEYAAEAVKFADLSERVPSVVAAILNSSSESNRLRASEVWMRGLELESKRKEEVITSRIPVEELDDEERGELIRKGILIGIGSWTYIRQQNTMGYEGGTKYWDELSAEELSEAVDRKIALALRWGKGSIWLGGMEFTITDAEERRKALDERAARLLEEVRRHQEASKEEIKEEIDVMQANPEPGTEVENAVVSQDLAIAQEVSGGNGSGN